MQASVFHFHVTVARSSARDLDFHSNGDRHEAGFDNGPEDGRACCQDGDINFKAGEDDHEWAPPGEILGRLETSRVLDNFDQSPQCQNDDPVERQSVIPSGKLPLGCAYNEPKNKMPKTLYHSLLVNPRRTHIGESMRRTDVSKSICSVVSMSSTGVRDRREPSRGELMCTNVQHSMALIHRHERGPPGIPIPIAAGIRRSSCPVPVYLRREAWKPGHEAEHYSPDRHKGRKSNGRFPRPTFFVYPQVLEEK